MRIFIVTWHSPRPVRQCPCTQTHSVHRASVYLNKTGPPKVRLGQRRVPHHLIVWESYGTESEVAALTWQTSHAFLSALALASPRTKHLKRPPGAGFLRNIHSIPQSTIYRAFLAESLSMSSFTPSTLRPRPNTTKVRYPQDFSV